MKKNIVFAAALLLAAVATGACFAAGAANPVPAKIAAAVPEEGGDIRISLFGQPFSGGRPPILVDGVTLVPLRGIAEALGAQVSWDDVTRSVTLRKDSSDIRLTIDSPDAVRNGEPFRLEAAPRLVGDDAMVPLRFIGESFDTIVTWDAEARIAAIDHLQSLPVVGTYDRLKELLGKAGQSRAVVDAGSASIAAEGLFFSVTEQAAAGRAESPSPSTSDSASSAKKEKTVFSATNTQVEGVDESDVVKTDGAYLYQVNRDRIVIVRAVPSDEMKVASVIGFDGGTFRPNELYVDDTFLVAIGSTARNTYGAAERAPTAAAGQEPSASVQSTIKIGPAISSSVKAIVYDITDKTAPKKLREIELDGRYVSSRKIGSALYLITNKSTEYAYAVTKENGSEAAGEAKKNMPAYRDSAVSADSIPLDVADIRYFPDSPETSYMLVGGINLDRPDQPADVSAYLGSGENVYASGQHLYVAVGKSRPAKAGENLDAASADSTKRKLVVPAYETNTSVYKFRLEQGKTKFVAQGEVPGTVLNQFSMDEHNGIFRIATMRTATGGSGGMQPANNLYTLDEALKPLGKVEDIAPGERIYSVRFMGNRAYMVTFKNTDPLFAIDLTNPAAPAVLGALKIPGYSDYLHPYDETHLIGFGKDTTEIPLKGDSVDPNRTVAYYQGMKLSLFDVTDVTKPVEMFKEIIGDRGTESELLRNHKALLFSKERDLLAFPVTVMEIPNKTAGSPVDATAYGQFKFQGAYVYKLDLTNGFQLRAPITHLTGEELLKSGGVAYAGDRNVERIVYIGDTLYTLSKGMIKANDMTTMQEKGSLPIR